MAGHAGSGCANASGASGGTGRSASSARLVLSMASAPRTSLTSARANASSRATSTSARSTSDCGAVPLAYRAFAAVTTSRAKAICSVDERRRPPALLQHQERVGRLHADVERRPAARRRAADRRSASADGATVAADAGQRNLLLDRDADVRAAQHERQVIERGRDHRVLERRDDGRAALRPRACARAPPESRPAARRRGERRQRG